jgi:hypothetical protein
MYFPPETQAQFLAISAALTGFEEIELNGTGVAASYWSQLVAVVGVAIAGELLSVYAGAFNRARSADELDREIASLFSDPKIGPLIENIIAMWYLGTWQQLPGAWRNAFGASANDVTQVVTIAACKESLVWRAFGAHPQGAKPTGFGSWAEPPLIRHAQAR